jgi:protein required for attachment to host cells
MAGTWVAIADGRKAILLENAGGALNPDLHVLRIDELDNPPTREQGADRAGRMNDGRSGGVRKSAFEATDFHQLIEDRFAAQLAAALDKAAARGAFDKLVIAAPPSALGALRAALSDRVKSRIALEIDSDLVNHPVAEIERRIAAAFDRRGV